jgi:TRAP transporter TAXI family solute receptor
MAEIINDQVEGYTASAEVTGGSVENMGLIALGEADLAFALSDTVQQAYAGEGRFNGQRLEMLRTLVGLYDNLVQIVTLENTEISSLAGLAGRRVSVGAPGSGTEVNARQVLNSAGLDFGSINVQRLNFNETADALRNGDIDAGFWSVAAPTSSILNLATNRSIRLIELSPAETEASLAASSVFRETTLPGGVYPGVEGPVRVLAVPNVLVVSADMPDELAYVIARAFFSHAERLVAIHPSMKQMTLDYTVRSTPAPLHPGVVRFLREAGVDVPDPAVR